MPAKAVCQLPMMPTDTPPSRASLAPTGERGQGGISYSAARVLFWRHPIAYRFSFYGVAVEFRCLGGAGRCGDARSQHLA
ncbi:hypothetical protein EMIT0P44_30014 [Pseudomonas sp. IT-P44]